VTITLIGSIGLVIALAVLFGWLARRVWRAQRALVKWPGAIICWLLALVCISAGGLALLGVYRVYLPGAAPAPAVQVAGSPEQVARGERLAQLCVGCHSSAGRLPLDGSAENFLDSLGTLYAPNLTPGGPLLTWSDGEILRAIREGVHADGRSLLIMPSDQYRSMSDADVQSVVAYLRTQPAVERTTAETQLNLLGALVMGTGIFPLSAQPPRTEPVQAPPVEATAEHGEYLVAISGCGECHGDDLQGGTSQFVPVGPNLRALLAQWSEEEFVQTIRTGVDPYGNAVNPDTMPWQSFSAAYGDNELQAIYVYIRSLPPGAARAE
jgi:mono/diheme cytochrome c family protein